MATETAVIDEIIVGVRAMASGDTAVLQLLEAFSRGVFEQASVMRETGMTARTYHAARMRMRRAFEAMSVTWAARA